MGESPAAVKVPKKMEDDLILILTANEVDKKIQTFLEAEGCRTVPQYAVWADDIQAEILDNFPDEIKKSRLQRTGLRQSKAEAEMRAKNLLKRQTEGLAPEELEEPLQPDVQRSLELAFRTRYHWTLPSEKRGSDSLLGRVRREFDRRQISMFSIFKTKSLAAAHQSQPLKRFKLGDSLEVVAQDASASFSTGAPSTVRAYFKQFQVLINTWAIAGCYTVEWERHPGRAETYTYADWQACCNYLEVFEDKAWEVIDSHADADVLAYIVHMEEFLRAKAIEISRINDHIPWGEALTQACLDNAGKWYDARDSLRSIQRSSSNHQRQPPKPPALAAPWAPPSKPAKGLGRVGGKDGGKGGKGGKGQLCETHSNGKPFCKAWNSRVGCKSPCEKGHLHGCDVMLAKGVPCCRTDHNRVNHDPAKHGKQAGE